MKNDQLQSEDSQSANNRKTEFTSGPWRVGWMYDRHRDENALAVWPAGILDGMVGNPICLLSPENKVDSSDEANAALISAAPELLAVLKRYEAWEARLIEADEAWQGRNFAITDELYEEFMDLQTLRNAAIAKVEKGGQSNV